MNERVDAQKLVKDIDNKLEKLFEEEKKTNLVVLGENCTKVSKFKELEGKLYKKIIQGKYNIDELLNLYKENGAVKLILDTDALEGVFDESNLRKLLLNVQTQNLILFSEKEFPSELLENIGIYNYTNLPEGVIFLLDNPRIQRQVLKNENAMLDEKILESLNNKQNNESELFELIDNFTGMSILIPRNWKALNREALYREATPNTLFIVYTDSNAQIQAVYDSKCSKEDFDKIYKQNIENMRNSGIKILSESSLIANLISGVKEFKQAVVEVANGNNLFKILQLFTIINNNFVSFSVIVDNNIDVNDLDSFNNQKNVVDLMNVIFSIAELRPKSQKVSDNYIGEMPKLGNYEEIDEDTPSSIDNKFDYSNIIPKIEDIRRLAEYCFKVYEDFKNKCDVEEEKNKQFKPEYKNYECTQMFSTGCEIRYMDNNYKTTNFKDYESFISSVNNENITNVMSLEINLCLDYKKGPGSNLVEHKNSFDIKFKPYEIIFSRKADFNELAMNNIENNINDIMNSFNSANTIFCTK